MNLRLITTTDEEFREISKLVYAKFGINLTDKKRNLVNGRLQKLLKRYSLKDFSEYLSMLKEKNSDSLYSELVDEISTNHTYFYRESQHFEFLMKRVLPEIEKYHTAKKSKSFKIWCAASSSGEEPYTLAIHLLEYFGASYSQWNGGLLATDISEDILKKAQRGIYAQENIAKVPPKILAKYFDLRDNNFYVKEIVKREVLFRKLNLVSPTFPLKGNFDLISCRNVMIYFDKETREVLLNKMYKQLRPGGYLFVGHSESLNGLDTPFSFVKSAIYRKDS